VLWLGEEALTILRAMEAVRDPGSLWLFPSRESKAGHLTTLKTFGRLVTRRTGLDGVKIHDLRRTFASNFLTNGVDVRTVMRLTGAHPGADLGEALCAGCSGQTQGGPQGVVLHGDIASRWLL